MASTKGYLMSARRASNNYRFLTSDHHPIPIQSHSFESELDESDVWGGSTRSDSPEPRPPTATPRPARKSTRGGGEARSVPVNIPDWSKILREEYKREGGGGGEKIIDGDFDGEEKMPPHEYLARNRMASLSVHEGIGRTLKGRDLSRLRNAIWEITGFQD